MATAIENLTREGITKGVHQVGDVMFDTTIDATKRAEGASRILDELGLKPQSYAVATIHRAENTDEPERFARVMDFIASNSGDVPVVMTVHPRTRKKLADAGISYPSIRMIDPIGYLDMNWLVHNSTMVLTDSGGLQKEAYFHRVPCVTVRDETEWTETIEAGWNRLWTTTDYLPRRDIDDYGTGEASVEIAKIIRRAG